MAKPIILKGKAIVIKDENGNPIESIDTDMIFHNRYLHITNIEEMGQYAFGNLKTWKDFPKMVKSNDILIVGKNFGAGSSRQQAVDCFTALGINLIIGESFGAIYKRNAINSGMALMTAPKIMSDEVETGDIIQANLETGELQNLTKNKPLINALPLFKVQLDIYQAGSLFIYGKMVK